jgi:Cof subfamily protein (haloacid dehalogenase superfamily)
MVPYRLLAVDLDGTLLLRDGRVDERDVAAIADARAAGVVVTIVTGRLHAGALGAARACGIAGAIACVEGSHLVEVDTARTLAHHPMSRESTAALRDALSEHRLASFVFEADGIHHDERGQPYCAYVRTWSPDLRLVEDSLDERVWANQPLAAVAIGDAEAVAACHAALRAHLALFAVSFAVWTCPGMHAVLVRAAGPSKGTALAELCQFAGCALEEAVVVGDWVNDVPMFEVAGRSFAMGTAPEAVRAKATDLLDRQAGTGGGIAEAIRRAWG